MEAPNVGAVQSADSVAGEVTPERAAFYKRIGQQNLAPLWELLKGLVPPEPKTPCVPALWRFNDVRKMVLEAGSLITAKEAERRVLILENPGLHGKSRITQSLYAGLQLILPGEVAPAHRHTASAIRFILDGDGAYTAVEGENTIMRRGDFVTTPNWAPHDHGNPSKQAMIWLDVLDLPTVNFFDAAFSEHLDRETQSNTKEDGDSYSRYGSGVLPDDAPKGIIRSPIINYPYARIKPVIERMAKSDDIDPRHGARVRYANPIDGGWATPTMGAHLALLPKGFKGKDYRSTDGTIFVCVEGEGSTNIENETFNWSPNDVFVVPSWKRYAHATKGESVLFSVSDRPAQEKLGLWREEA
ncbi:MAG: gentisate 1,2-dioxygenase [Xanthobacteraceae bacterium]